MRESKIKGTLYHYDPKLGKMVKICDLTPSAPPPAPAMEEEGLVPDQERTEEIAFRIVEMLRDSYLEQKGPQGRVQVLTILNALAMSTGLVIKGCDDPVALEFFSNALNKNLR